MNNIPIAMAERSEIEAPMTVALQTVRKADGLSCFQTLLDGDPLPAFGFVLRYLWGNKRLKRPP